MQLPRIVLTGASGFVGRHILDALKGRYKIHAIARRSQKQSDAPIHPNILWHRVDIGDYEALAAVFSRIRELGGADICIHLAAYYDFTGEEHPEYERTNIMGLRNILELCQTLKLKRFIFASSTAACKFRPPDQIIDESTPPDGDHIYARTKRIGEQMLKEYSATIPSVILRFAALFSDWCEYPPLYMFLGSWLSETWTSNVLGGTGRSSVPYLHIQDIVKFTKVLLDKLDSIDNGEILIASTQGSITHRQLFDEATLAFFGQRKKPTFIPKILCPMGVHMRRFFGNFTGHRPFESPWMCRYIDLQMNVDFAKTSKLLGWTPRPRLEMIRRIPFMVENFRSEPAEWHHRNTAALKVAPLLQHLKIHNMLKAHEKDIKSTITSLIRSSDGKRRFPGYSNLPPDEQRTSRRQLFMHLMNAIRTRDKSLFRTYCQELAEKRFEQGFDLREVAEIFSVWNKVCIDILSEDSAMKELPFHVLRDYITITLQFGIDEIQEVYEQLGDKGLTINLYETSSKE